MDKRSLFIKNHDTNSTRILYKIFKQKRKFNNIKEILEIKA